MKRIKMMLLVLFLAITITGCSQKLAEKEIVLVADADTLIRGEEQSQLTMREFSHLKLLVIHEKLDETLIDTLLNRDEISLQTKVAYCEDNISPKTTEEKETLNDQMRHYRFQHTVTVLELMNTCYSPGTQLYLPRIEIREGKITETDAVVFRGGENRVSFQ